MMKKLTMFLCLACAWMCSLQAQEAKTFFKICPIASVHCLLP